MTSNETNNILSAKLRASVYLRAAAACLRDADEPANAAHADLIIADLEFAIGQFAQQHLPIVERKRP